LTAKADEAYTNYNIYSNESHILVDKATEATLIEQQALPPAWLQPTND